MSLPIWTPDALRFEAQPFAGTAWRLVEAQHRVSTLKLVDNLAEQAALEAILEDTKPALPEECRALDYLLATPFRYRPRLCENASATQRWRVERRRSAAVLTLC